jgi:hypothetical protein
MVADPKVTWGVTSVTFGGTVKRGEILRPGRRAAKFAGGIPIPTKKD